MARTHASPMTARILTALTLPKSRRVVADHLRGDGTTPRRLRVLLWWWASVVVTIVYSLLRGKMDNLGAPVHGQEWEEMLFGSLPTIWLQENIWAYSKHNLEWASVIVHSSWFFVPMLAGILVSFRRPNRIGSFFRWWIALELLALPLFAALPTQPPWMANSEVTRLIALRFGGEIADSNPLAAMPSLHVAFPLVLALWFNKEQWRWPAIAMFAYTGAISVEVVFSGEHYIVDVLGAAVLAGAVALGSRINMRSTYSRLSSLGSRGSVGETGRLKPALEAVRAAPGKERGQALIELALVLPIILVFILVLVDFGIAVDRRQVLQHAVRDGVRFGAVGNSAALVQAHVVDQSIDILTPAQVEVCYVDENSNGNPGNSGDSIKVTAHYTYEFSIGGGEMLTALHVPVPSIDMNPSATLRLETSVAGAVACP